MSNAAACSESRPLPSTSHHHTESAGVADADMVGHDVDQHAEAGRRARRFATCASARLTAAAVVDLAVVDHVVAVLEPGSAASTGDRYTQSTPIDRRYGTSAAASARSHSGVICSR